MDIQTSWGPDLAAAVTRTNLAGGQSPRLPQHLGQEGRLDLQVLGHDVEAEEVAVDALAGHGQLVGEGVLLHGRVEKTFPLLLL